MTDPVLTQAVPTYQTSILFGLVNVRIIKFFSTNFQQYSTMCQMDHSKASFGAELCGENFFIIVI